MVPHRNSGSQKVYFLFHEKYVIEYEYKILNCVTDPVNEKYIGDF